LVSREVTTTAEPAETLSAALNRAVLALLQALALLLPLVLVALVLAVVGVVLGFALGGAFVESILNSHSNFGHGGGEFAALFVGLAALAPPILLGLGLPLYSLPWLALIQSVGLLFFPFRDRHVVIWSVTLGLWVPVIACLVAVADPSALVAAYLVGAPFGLLGAAGALACALIWFGYRLLLNGRSLGLWWEQADASMLVATILLLAAGAVPMWLSPVLFCFLPLSPFMLMGSMTLAGKQLSVGRRVPANIAALSLAALHLLAIAVVLLAATFRNR
jgi:hypothetical protein